MSGIAGVNCCFCYKLMAFSHAGTFIHILALWPFCMYYNEASLSSLFEQLISLVPTTIFTPKILYLCGTIKNLRNPNPLTTIPANQPQHDYNPSRYIITFLTSSTLKTNINQNNQVWTWRCSQAIPGNLPYLDAKHPVSAHRKESLQYCDRSGNAPSWEHCRHTYAAQGPA